MSARYPNKEFPVAELRVGDVLKQFEGPFGTAIVEQANNERVVLFRPYGATPDFTYGGQPGDERIITYTGREETTFLRSDKAQFLVYQRRD